MAIQAILKRVHVLKSYDGSQEVGTAALTGTYVTGGFTFDTRGLTGGLGTSPYGGTPVYVSWQSPLGYTYVSTFGTGAASTVMTTKIYTAANIELAAGSTPEATVPFLLLRRKV